MCAADQRQILVETARALTHGRTGNLSVRSGAGFLITPSGIPNESLQPDQVVFMALEGSCPGEQLKPSSEWRFHRDLYLQRYDIGAIIHTHSTYATVLACLRKPIPAFHYMVADAGGEDIRCAEYATFGTQALSDNIITAMQDRKACLMANHGMLAVGDDLAEALERAQLVEELAKQYVLALQTGDPVILSSQEMAVNLEKFKRYGKQNEEN